MNHADCINCPGNHFNTITGRCGNTGQFYADVLACEYYPEKGGEE